MNGREERVKELLRELAELGTEYWERAAGLHAEIGQLQAQELQVKEAYLPEFTRLKEEIVELMKEIGRTVELEEVGIATYRKGYVRYTWDSKGLESYAGKHPAVMQFRKATAVDPGIKVQVYE